jgi:copper(I)-binding protein
MSLSLFQPAPGRRPAARPHFVLRALLAAALLATPFAASAHEFKLGTLEIIHPWARATPGGARVGAGYVKVVNHGTEPDRLVSVTAPDRSDKVEIHEMSMADGVMVMRPLPAGLEIKPGETVELKPGSYHLMFQDLKAPIKEGEKIDGTLVFEKAGSVKVYFSVSPVGAGEPAHQHEAPKTN